MSGEKSVYVGEKNIVKCEKTLSGVDFLQKFSFFVIKTKTVEFLQIINSPLPTFHLSPFTLSPPTARLPDAGTRPVL